MKKFASLFTAMTVLAASFAAAEGNIPAEANAEVKESNELIIENKEEQAVDNTALSSEAVGAGEGTDGQPYEESEEATPAKEGSAAEAAAEETTSASEETPEGEASPQTEPAAEEVTPAEGEEQEAPAAEAEERFLRLEKYAFTVQSLTAAPGEAVTLTLDMKVDEPDGTVLQPMTMHVDLGEAQSYQVIYASPALTLSGGSKGLYVELPESTVKEGRIILPEVIVKNADGTTDTAPAGELKLVLQVIPFAEEDARSRAVIALELEDEDGLYQHYHGAHAAYINKEVIEETTKETTEEEAPAEETQDGAASNAENEPEAAEGETDAAVEEQPVTEPEEAEETEEAGGEAEEAAPEVPSEEQGEHTPEETPAEEAAEETEQAAGETEEIVPEEPAGGEDETAPEDPPAEEPGAAAEEEMQNDPEPEETPAAAFDPAKVKLMCQMNIPSAEVKAGDTWQLTAVTEGLENVLWTLQWEYSTDGEHWQAAEGETGDTLTVLIDETNLGTLWRYTVNIVIVK